MTRGICFAPAAAIALALTACGGGSSDVTENDVAMANDMAMNDVAMNDMAMNDMNMAGDNMMMNGSAAAPMAAAEFANAAAASDMYEIESSKLAQTKASDAGIKSFAQMLVTDHTKSTADLKAAGGKASPAITPAPAMTAEQQANLTALRNAGAADFDRLYVEQQVPAHEKALAMLQSYAAGGDVPSLKDFASRTAPVVQAHLEQARTMRK